MARRQLQNRTGLYVPTNNPWMKRNYDAGTVNNLTATWTTVPLSANETLRRYLVPLRARSREQVENNDYARKFVTMVKNNVVGADGFQFQARTQDANGQPDKLANDAIEAAWRKWASKGKYCDVNNRLNLLEQQKLFAASVATDGEVLIRLYRGSQYGEYGFKIKFIDPELLNVYYNKDLASGNIVRMGIEFTPAGTPVAYHLSKLSYENSSNYFGYNYSTNGVEYERVPAEEIFHCFVTERVEQWRGFPWMSTALSRLNMLGGFEEAALVNARAGASKMGFYKNTGDLSLVADQNTNEPFDFMDVAEPGTWHKLPPGIDVETYNPTYPNNEFDAFMKGSLRGISAGLGVSYPTYANDLQGVNYSSGRIGMLDEREAWKLIQNWMKGSMMHPLYDAWLEEQLLRGNITVNGNPLRATQLEKYERVEFQGKRWQWVDPAKEETANEKALEMRTKSRSQIIREQGRDPIQVWEEIAKENEILDQLGITPEQADAAMVPPADQSPPGEEEGEEGDT